MQSRARSGGSWPTCRCITGGFLLTGDTYSFLEVNPNGEWGWLDESGEAGILNALASELCPDTPCHPLPNPRVIDAAGRLMR